MILLFQNKGVYYVKSKKEKWFTLIELLVVIALMLSILGIAIVSFINISNKKKQEAWEDVKAQIETAATEYFTANEYLFEGFSDGSAGSISVGMLVNEDYLNKITDPRNGKAVSYCSLVNVNKVGEKLTATFDESFIESSTTECDNNNSIILVKEEGGPEINSTSECDNEGKNGWCRGTHSTKLSIIKNHGAIISKKFCIGEGSNCNENIELQDNNTVTDSNNGDNRVTKITVTNQTGRSAYVISTYKIDSVAPTISYENMNIAANSSYEGKNVYDVENNPLIKVKAQDTISGISSVKRKRSSEDFLSYDGDYYFFPSNYGDVTDTFVATDRAGNKSETPGKYIVYSKPSCPSFSTDGTIGDDGSTYISNINIYASMDNEEDVFVGNLFGNGNYWFTKEYKTGFLETLTDDAMHQYYGHVRNKYGLISGDCYSEIYTKDTIPPACPYLSYGFYKTTIGTWDGECYNAATGGVYNVTDSNTIGSWTNLTCKYVKDVIPNATGTKIAIYASPSSDTIEMDWYTNNGPGTGYGNLIATDYWSTWPHNGNWPKTLTADDKNDGYRLGVFVVRDAAGNENYCYTPIFKIKTATASETPSTKCYKNTDLTYDGTKGDNNWYKSNVVVKNGNTSLCTISDEGKNQKCSYKIGNKTCYTGGKNIDKTPPTMNINSGPTKVSCNNKNSIQTKYKAKDSVSGLAIVKDYYGYDNNIPGPGSGYWRNRSIESGVSSYNHDHNWGPTCTSKGTPASGTCYYLKYYLKDKAGWVASGKTSSCATY